VREGELRGSFSHHVEPRGIIRSESEDAESRGRASTGSSPAIMSPPRPAMTPNPNQGAIAPPPSHTPLQSEARIMQSRLTPPGMDRERDRDRDRGVEVQLQEAAKSSLAHANSRLGQPEGKAGEYQTMVA
jgi:hypothetical protein